MAFEMTLLLGLSYTSSIMCSLFGSYELLICKLNWKKFLHEHAYTKLSKQIGFYLLATIGLLAIASLTYGIVTYVVIHLLLSNLLMDLFITVSLALLNAISIPIISWYFAKVVNWYQLKV